MNVADRPEDLPRPQDMQHLSGMEQLDLMMAGKTPSPPIAATVGYRLVEVAPGRAVFHGTPTFEVCNPMGTVHGGWYGTLLDSAMACAVMTEVPKGAVQTTLEYKVNIIRPIPLGMEIAAIGTLQHGGRSTGIAMGEIRGVEDGRLYATGSTTCIIMPIPPQS